MRHQRSARVVTFAVIATALGCAPGGGAEDLPTSVPFRRPLLRSGTLVDLPIGVYVARDQETLDGWFSAGGLADGIDFSKEIVVYRRAETCENWCENPDKFYYLLSAQGDTVVVELPWVEDPKCGPVWCDLPPDRSALLALPVEYKDYRFEAR